jgi:hypothetical protein
MISDLDIYRAAKLLIDQHGDDAPIRVAERSDELLGKGDTEGAAIWRAIMAAIEELQRDRAPEKVNREMRWGAVLWQRARSCSAAA